MPRFNKSETEIIIDKIKNILKIAGKFDGWCHGEYIHEVFVPLEANSNFTPVLDNLDLKFWFKNKYDKSLFVDSIVKLKSANSEIKMGCTGYYQLFVCERWVCDIKFYISKKLLISQFNILNLIANIKDDEMIFRAENKENVLSLKYHILNKKVVIYDDFVMKNFIHNKREDIIDARILNNYNIYFHNNQLMSKSESRKFYVNYISNKNYNELYLSPWFKYKSKKENMTNFFKTREQVIFEEEKLKFISAISDFSSALNNYYSLHYSSG